MAASINLTRLLDHLPNSPDKVETLNHIKTLLQAMNKDVIRNVVSNVSFNVIFECLGTTNSEQVALCCAVLSRLLSSVDPAGLLSPFHEQFLMGLSHADPQVQKLSVNQLLRAAEHNSQQVLQYSDILVHLVQLLASNDTSVIKSVSTTLTLLGGTPGDLSVLLQHPIITQLQTVSQSGDLARFRVYDLAVQWGSVSSESLQLLDNSGLLQQLLNELLLDDVLLQLNCLQLLTKMAETPHSWRYLQANGITSRLHSMLGTVEVNPMMRLLLPGLVKFFGNVGHLQPREVCDRFPQFIALLTTLLEGRDDPTLQCIAIETIGYIGHTADGKRAIAKHSEMVDIACRVIGQIIASNSSNETRVRAIEALCRMMQLTESEQSSELFALTESWFRQVSANPLELLMNVAREPFNEVRCANLQLFCVLAMQPWAQQLLHSHATFCEFLLDRKSETIAEASQAKYDIVRCLAASPTTESIFGSTYMAKLREYQKTGPFAHTAQSAVAVQQGD